MMVREAVTHDCFGMASGCAGSARWVSKNMRERREVHRDYSNGLFDTQAGSVARVSKLSKKRGDTFFEGKKAEETSPRKSTPRTLKPGRLRARSFRPFLPALPKSAGSPPLTRFQNRACAFPFTRLLSRCGSAGDG